MNKYTKAPADVIRRVTAMRKKYHPELDKARVRIDVLMVATIDGEDGSPLKRNGYPADALAKIIPQEQRAAGRGDAVILIDAEEWKDLSDKKRDALVDHELEHFQVKMEDDTIALDGNGRPKLKLRRHTVQIGWFDTVAKRHGENSMEVTQARALITRAAEIYLPGFEFMAKGEKKDAKNKVVQMPAQAPAVAAAAAK